MGSESQHVNNHEPIKQQVNINNVNGNLAFTKVSRLAQRFKRLKEEVECSVHYNKFIDDFNRYNTKLDGRSMPDKLSDGGFQKRDIDRATYRKHQYVKKLERNKLYETAQLIDLELFAIINLNFETYIEPLIDSDASTNEIKVAVKERIIDQIYNLLNEDGMDDTFLNYNVDDLYGMIFFLTGKCHLNWTNYDNL